MSGQTATLQQQPPVLTDEHKLLDAFVGEWMDMKFTKTR